MKIAANISISRSSDDYVRITISCIESRIKFVEVKLDLESYARLVTGQSFIECDGEVRNLELVGKRKIVEKRSVVAPFSGYNREKYEEWLKNEYHEGGWIVRPSLNSQGSIRWDGDNTILNFFVEKFEDIGEKP